MDQLPVQGLTAKEAAEKLRVFGKNEIIVKKTTTPFSLFLSQFPTIPNGILTIAALFSFFLHDVFDGLFIVTILFVNGTFGFFQEYRAEKALEKLKEFVKPVSRIIRDNSEQEIPTSHIVPGDVVILTEGDRIPVDGELLLNGNIEIDESILTGESLPVIKQINDTLYSGTLVIKGRGKLLVKKTGMVTRIGEITKTLATVKADKTPLEKRINQLGKILSFVFLFIAALIIPLGFLQGKELFSVLFLAISIGVAAIPESLPAIITIALAVGTNRMAKKNAIVRKMAAIETLGSVQVILVDKTGTLTQNAMRVKKFWTKDKESFPHLLQACNLGNTASLIQEADEKNFDVIGDKTDGALLLWLQTYKEEHLAFNKDGKVIDEFVFDPMYKTITTVWQKNKQTYIFVRGAPEAILEKSRLSKKEKEELESIYQTYAKEGLRVIGFGSKLEIHPEKKNRTDLEQDLNFLGLIGIYDPPRLETKKAVEEAKRAGIIPVMVTGDNALTALTIAKEVGLVDKTEDVVTGEELKTMTDDELKKILGKVRIFARTQPEDKLRLVSLFNQAGYVTAVTGDGVNDTLALKKADVGIAMGKSGTDVAKEASDIILADDNFSTIVKAVEEGRIIYSNIVKATTYLLSGNFAELLTVFLAAVLNMPNPLLPTQILWMNLVTDGLPALALASDSKDPSLIHNKPRNPNVGILTRNRVLFIFAVGITLSVSLLILYKILLGIYSETLSRTIIFNLLILSHIGIVFAARGRSMLVKPNKFLIFAILVTVFLQATITIVPFFQKIFHLGW